MSETILETDDDLSWAVDTHGIPRETKFAILVGNEDAPQRILCWFDSDPDHDDQPDVVVVP